MTKRRLTWTKRATRHFNAAIEYIRQDFEQNAEKVKDKMLDKIGQLTEGKIIHRKDPYKKDNDGSFLYLR